MELETSPKRGESQIHRPTQMEELDTLMHQVQYLKSPTKHRVGEFDVSSSIPNPPAKHPLNKVKKGWPIIALFTLLTTCPRNSSFKDFFVGQRLCVS